jgi:uncharacterized protein YjbI with pentapeptide repeats
MAELTREEVISKVKAGESLAEKDLCGLNLSKTNLSRADLSKTKLIDAYLTGANLSKVDLKDADLSQTKLIAADLTEADLSGAHLGDADLSMADLNKARLNKTHLNGANLSLTSLSDADLSKADFLGADLLGANLINASLPDADLSKADLAKADFSKANLKGANLQESNLDSVNFTDADLSGADLSGANIWNIITTNWNIEGVRCEYVYNCKYWGIIKDEDKEKTRRNFAPGEFVRLYHGFPKLELIFSEEYRDIDYRTLLVILGNIKRRLPRANIKLNKIEQTIHATATIQTESQQTLEQVIELLVELYQQVFDELNNIKKRLADPARLGQSLQSMSMNHRQLAEYFVQNPKQWPQAPQSVVVSGKEHPLNISAGSHL